MKMCNPRLIGVIFGLLVMLIFSLITVFWNVLILIHHPLGSKMFTYDVMSLVVAAIFTPVILVMPVIIAKRNSAKKG